MMPRWRGSRTIRAVATGALVLAPLAGSPVAAQNIPVSAGSNASSLVGVDFLLPIEIDMSQRTDTLQSFVLTVRWNAAVLELLGGGSGTFGDLDGTEDSIAHGVIQLSGTNTRNIGGRFSVAVGRFRPLAADTTTIEVSVEQLIAKTSLADLRPNVALTNRSYCPALGRVGDPDGNGLIDTRDVLITLSAAVGLDVSQFNAAMGDVDGDGLIQAVDALIILSRVLGIDVGASSRLFSITPGSCAPSTALASFFLVPGDATVVPGSRIEYSALATDSSGATVALVDVFWRVSDLRVAAVTPDGVVQTLDTGTTVVTAFRSGRPDSAQSTVTVIGTDILFRSNRGGDFDIYRVSANFSGAPTNLTQNPAREINPEWSPDRAKFAFASDRSGNNDIYIANIDGTGITQLTTNTANDNRPNWSPDGNKIAFRSDRDGNFEIYVINVDGTGLTNLTNDPGFDSSPAWSPDGSRIAFHSDRDGDPEIYVMSADGTGVTNLTNNTVIDVVAAWSPDGSQIAFTSGSSGELDVFVINADGSNRVQLTFEAGVDSKPNFSPDGSLIVFWSNRDGDRELYVMDASDGNNVVQLTHNPAVDDGPTWR